MDRRWRRVALAGIAALAIGCTASGSSAGPTGVGAPSASRPGAASTEPSTVGPTPVVGEAPQVRLLGDAPVLRGRDGPPGFVYILPGAAIEHDSTIHAWLVRFTETPGTQLVVHSASPDGRTWTTDAEAAYTDLGLGFGVPGPIPADVRVDADGTWVLYSWGEPDDGSRTVVTWKATAPGPGGPWTAERILGPGDAGRWDDAAVRVASVLLTPAGGLELYYEAWSQGSSRLAIGLATSADGVTWTRVGPPGAGAAGGPVLEPGRCAGVDATRVTLPNVTATPNGRLMLFTGFLGQEAVVGAATSRDGVTWSCAGEGPVLGRNDVPGSQGLHNVELFERSTGPTLLVETLGDRTTDVWLGELTLP